MGRNYKAGILITGDSKGAQKAINLTATEVENLDKTTAKSKTHHKNYSKSIVGGFSDMAAKAAKWGAAAVAAGAVATTAMVKSGLASADALAKTSDKLGVTTEALARLRFAAEQTGIETKTFDIALQRFTRRLGDAAAGTGPAVKAFDALGLSAKDLIELSPDEALGRVADKMGLVENQSQKVSLAFKLFDSEGVALVNTLALGADGLERMAYEADILGLSLSRIDAAKAEQANDAMNRIGKSFEGFSQQLAIKFAPIITDVADRIFGVAEEAGGMGEVATEAFNAIVTAAGVLADTIYVLEVGWISMKIGFLGAASAIATMLEGLVRGAIDLYNKLPWVDKVQYTADFAGFAMTWEDEVNKGYQEVARIMNKPLPSDAIDTYVADVTRQYEVQAESAIATQAVVQDEIITTEEVTKSLATTTTTATKEVVSAWDKALQDTAARIDTAFAGAWKGAFESFESFTSSIKDALKQTLAEMAHILITKPLIVGITGAFGFGSTAAGAATAGVPGGGGGILSSGASLLSSGFSGLGGGYEALGTFASNLGFTGYGDAAYNTGLSYGTNTLGQNLMQGGLNIGAGLLGGYAGSQVFGSTSGLGGTAGGFLGSPYGPVGTAIGSFIGTGLESAFNSVFGQKNNGDNKGGGIINFATGADTIQGYGKSFNQENVDAANDLKDVMLGFANLLGGSNARFGIEIGNNSGLTVDGTNYGEDIEGALGDAFARIAMQAQDLDKHLRDLIIGFDGTIDQTFLFAESIISLAEQIKTNPVAEAEAQYLAARENSVTVYQRQITTISTLVSNFDGSAAAAAELNAALAANRTTAFQLASAILNVSDQMNSMFASSAQQIRESIMTDEEKIAAWTTTRDELRNSLSGILDPAELQATGQEINRLNSLIFSTLSEEAQLFSAETFARYAEDTAVIVDAQLDKTLTKVQVTQEQINHTINAMLHDTAAIWSINTDAFATAVNKFAGATETASETADKNAATAAKVAANSGTTGTADNGLSYGGGPGGPYGGLNYDYYTGQYGTGPDYQQTIYLGTGVVGLTNKETGEEVMGYYENGLFVAGEVNV